MIDEKRLDRMKAQVEYASYIDVGDIDADELLELIRVYRIGVWAEKHGIPVLEAFKTTDYEKKWCNKDESSLISSKWFHGVCSGERANEALAALPPDMKEKK